MKLARFYGIPAVRVQAAEGGELWEGRPAPLPSIRYAVAASAETLAALMGNPDLSAKVVELLFSRPASVLAYGFTPGAGPQKLLPWLTAGKIQAVSPIDVEGGRYEVTNDSPSVCQQMSGITFGPTLQENDSVFGGRSDDPSILDLITIQKKPFFMSLMRGPCRLYLLASKDVADIDEYWGPSQTWERVFSRLAPYVMFLRHVMGDSCWHAPKRFASLVIDDPLLKDTYGALSYARLLKEMDRRDFFSNIAFIPVNYRRSRRATTELFLRRPDRFALCIHGCDHTKAEFGDSRFDILNEKAGRAILRMQRHETLTGLPFEKVMVFPQGLFSSEAMRALKRNRYLAAVNTHGHPTHPFAGLRLSHLLEPAVTAYEGFPLFLRRTPENIASFAFDLFLGKPALIVVHQDYFRKGYDGLGDFIQKIHSVDPGLCWKSLKRIVTETCLVRREAPNIHHVRAYASFLVLENHAKEAATIHISKDEPAESTVAGVLFSGVPVPFQREPEGIYASIELGPDVSGGLEIIYEDRLLRAARQPGPFHAARVRTRRLLSEIRDEHVSQSSLLRYVLARIRKAADRR